MRLDVSFLRNLDKVYRRSYSVSSGVTVLSMLADVLLSVLMTAMQTAGRQLPILQQHVRDHSAPQFYLNSARVMLAPIAQALETNVSSVEVQVTDQ